jgi:uncharacterized membrane protein
MVLLIIFTLVGMGVGEAIFYDNGWLIGAALGFLITKLFQLNNSVKQLERDLKLLQSQNQQIAQPVQQPATQTAAVVAEPAAQHVPLAERLKAHGIALPPETPSAVRAPSATANDLPISDAELESLAMTTAQPVAETSKPAVAATYYTPPVREPAAPNAVEVAFDKAFAHAKRFFTEGNPIVRIGMVVMFFGLSFLVKYASSQNLLPIELRMAAVAAVAIALIGLGWKTRAKEGGYGLVLQGGGIAALYLTVFAAAKLYELMPIGAAFALMFIIVMLGALLAILQNAQVLAVMATAGGFLAPILTSDGSGNHVGLFSFYLLLNIGILTIAWFKTWRLLNWIGFVFTFVITSAWGVLKYEPHLYASTQPFLIAFFALYLTVSILFSLKQPPNLKGLVDGSLTFGLPIVGFGLQTALLKHTEYGLAISALILSAIYISLARLLWAKYQTTHRVLIESFIALGATFATLTIPLALDAQWTSATWALEATGLIWIGLRQQRLLPRCAGYLLHIAAACSLLLHDMEIGPTPIISGDFINLLMLAASALCISYLLTRFVSNSTRYEKPLANLTMIIGWLWWLLAGTRELNAHLPGEHEYPALMLFFAASVAALIALGKKVNWPELARIGFWLLPLGMLLSLHDFGEGLFIGYDVYPSQRWGLLALGIYFAVLYRFLWQQTGRSACGILSAYHVVGAWFIFSLVFWEASYWQSAMQWHGTSLAVLAFACLTIPLVALLYFTRKPIWPFAQHSADYKNLIPAPLIFGLLLWFIVAGHFSGATGQFYLPILNPLDLTQAAVLLIFAYAIKCGFIGMDKMPAEFRYGALGLLAFAWINIVLLRAIHHYTGIEYVGYILWDSVIVQMSLSILWAICALVVMNLSRRLQERKLWMLGAGLLAIIVLKLFTKDVSGTGTLERIVSFIVVSGLMMLIGYLSPIPAKAKAIEKAEIE